MISSELLVVIIAIFSGVAALIGAFAALIQGKAGRLIAVNDAQKYVNNRVRESDEKIDRLEHKLERFSKDKTKLEDRVQELEESLKVAQEKSKERGVELATFKQLVLDLEEKLKIITQEFYMILKENQDTTRELSIKKLELMQLQEQLANCHKIVEDLQSQLGEYMDGKI